MENWKLAQGGSDWDFQTHEQQESHLAKLRATNDMQEDQDPVELIHQRRKSSFDKSGAFDNGHIHTIPIESRYIVVSPEEDGNDEEEPDEFLRNIKDAPHTLLDKQCIAQDVINIWEAISEYIILKLKRGLGTIIPGLGTFTYLIKNVNCPKTKSCKLHIYPKFFISEYVAEMYGLNQPPSHHSNVPNKLMNLSIISKRINIPRSIVEGAVTEVLQAFARGLVCNKNIEFPFPCIGKLQVSNQCVRMTFYLDFYKTLKYNIEQPSVLKQDGNDVEDSVIEGRMTPLVYHIPAPKFRSVFHLREVRSVHEDVLLAPVEYHKGRLIPKKMMKDTLIKEEMFDYLEKYQAISVPAFRINEDAAEPPSPVSQMGEIHSKPSKHSIRSEIEEIVAQERQESPNELPESLIDSAQSKFVGTESDVDEADMRYFYSPKPLFLEQETGIKILDKRLENKSYFTKELEKFVIGQSTKTLGHAKVFSHLKRTLNVHPHEYEQQT